MNLIYSEMIVCILFGRNTELRDQEVEGKFLQRSTIFLSVDACYNPKIYFPEFFKTYLSKFFILNIRIFGRSTFLKLH